MNNEESSKKTSFYLIAHLIVSLALFRIYIYFNLYLKKNIANITLKHCTPEISWHTIFLYFFPNFLAQLCLRLSLARVFSILSRNVYYSGILEKRVTLDYVKAIWCVCMCVFTYVSFAEERETIHSRTTERVIDSEFTARNNILPSPSYVLSCASFMRIACCKLEGKILSCR